MQYNDIKRLITYVLTYSSGGIVGLIFLHILNEQNYLTWKNILTIIVIATIGSFIGIIVKRISKR